VRNRIFRFSHPAGIAEPRKSGPATSQRSPPVPVTTERYSLCRLNAGPGRENPDEPPDCLYGLQVRGSPFSLRGSLFWVLWGFRSGGSALLFVDLCAGKYIEYERGGPQHPAHGGVTFPGILFMTWRAQEVMNGWLLVFLFEMCCHKAS